MKPVAELKRSVLQAVDTRKDLIYEVGEAIMRQPELGYKEHKTAALVSSQLDRLGIAHRTGLAITGIKAVLDTGRPGPTVAVLGELDSVLVRDHPLADPQTGAAHACGHNAQIASLLGVAMALTQSDVLDSLSGRVALFAVPAEEYVEVEYRLGLKREGKIEFLGGKPELVRLGEMDDVDMAMMVHTGTHGAPVKLAQPVSMNGFVAKFVEYIGRAAHAGGAPDKGINALNAAMLGLSAIHANRETFRDQDGVRVHPIITKGGDLVNVVPADVRMEAMVRARSLEAILDAEKKVDRALRAGALGVGAKVRITTIPGYLPYQADPLLSQMAKRNATELVGEEGWLDLGHLAPSTDMGDLSQIMPAVQPETGGAVGTHHAANFAIEDRETAYLNPTRLMCMMLVELLADDAAGARRVLAETPQRMSRADYLQRMRELDNMVTYDEG